LQVKKKNSSIYWLKGDCAGSYKDELKASLRTQKREIVISAVLISFYCFKKK
jgi:hypothetical protein